MLAGNGDSTLYMYNALKDQFNIEKVIIEESTNRKTFIKRRIKNLGFFKAFGQIIFMIYSKSLLRFSKKRIIKLKKDLNLIDKKIEDNITINVNSANSKKTKSLLQELNPDIVIVNGTRIISKNILNSIDGIFINTHLGITPKYRGVHGGYWALANNDKDNFGTTVHIVDTGIDTGKILMQKTTTIEKEDNYSTYPLHQIKLGIEIMEEVLKDFKNNKMEPYSNNLESAIWSHPDIISYFKNRILSGVK